LAEIAGAHRGLVQRRQLTELGITRGSFNHRISAGSLHHVLPSVLSGVHPLLEPCVVLRFTWPQLTHRPALVVATIARTIGRLEAQPGP
jgi:hypothetical protein